MQRLMCFLAGVCVSVTVVAQPPDDSGSLSPELKTLQPGITLTLVAEHPDVVTPTGIDVDSKGNVWVASSHTHFRPDNYEGPEHDEILVFGRNGRRVFYAKTDATMDLELGAAGDPLGWVYLAERDRILRVRDSDGDGVGDIEENVAVLETEEQYPHNGLSGMCWDPDGTLVFGLGENYWKDWTLTGTDGRVIRGQGEGGIFRVNADGTRLRRIARGFWNPFGVCVRSDGEIFVAENDPGARPPCRLLHVVEGGDYGYQRAYGRAPFHPFVAWNGELRGTLPMLHAIGEAPCGVAPLGGGLLLPSWADHRIDFFPLRRDGAGFETERIELVSGSDNFRPVCIAQQDSHTFFLTDWVYGSYELHQRGRVWKLQVDPKAASWIQPGSIEPPNDAARLARHLLRHDTRPTTSHLLKLSRSDDPYLAHAALMKLSRNAESLRESVVEALPAADRVSVILALKLGDPLFHGNSSNLPHRVNRDQWIELFLKDRNSDVLFETLRWIADTNRDQYLPQVERMLQSDNLEYSLFEACLATWNTLSGNARAGISDPAMLLSRVNDPKAPAAIRAFALRLLPAKHKDVKVARLKELLSAGNAELKREAIRTLAERSDKASRDLLLTIASSDDESSGNRADAIVGLVGTNTDELIGLAGHPDTSVRNEAIRALRFEPLSDAQRGRVESAAPDGELRDAVLTPESLKANRPAMSDIKAWRKLLNNVDGPANVEAGRRIFRHAKVGLCANCHRHSGRGNVVGPDLSAVSTQGDPDRLLKAVLQPSRDVDPQYYPWTIVLDDGKTFTGILLRKGGRSGREFYRDSEGNEQSFLKSDIVLRKELKTSLMPEKLVDTLTTRELRDLLAFLDSSH